MLYCTQARPTFIRRAALNVLTAFLMLAAAPAFASVTINGVTKGQVVTGDLEVTATANVNRLIDLTIVLTGPEGTVIVNRSTGKQVHLVQSPEDAQQGLPWDSTQAAAGKYAITAFAASRGSRGRVITADTVNFYVQNDNLSTPVAPPPTSTPSPEAPADPEPETPAVETPAVETPTPEVVENETVVETETPAEPVAPTPDVTPSAEAPAPPISQTVGVTTIAFAVNTPTQRILGDSATINIELDNPAADADVLFLVWDLDRKAVVDNVSATLTAGNLTVGSNVLDQLPTGNLELQAHYREGGVIVKTAKHVMLNAAPTPQVEPTGPEAMPTVRFSANSPATRIVGSTAGVSFELEGELPESGDVLAIA
ncbi:MAG: hypothetical protein AAGJ38_07370, partial [Planctomycetota bacterium]